jgi:hypothetical protein
MQTVPSNGIHPLIQDGADMNPLKPTHLAKGKGLCLYPQGGLEKVWTPGSPNQSLPPGSAALHARWDGVLTGHPCARGGKERHPQRQSANKEGTGCWGTCEAGRLGRLQLPLSVCMQGDRLEN